MLLLIWFYSTLFVSESLSAINQYNSLNIRVFVIFFVITLSLGFQRYFFFPKILKINVYFFGVFFYTGSAIIAGLFIAPNNYDSMTYHFPRYLHWLSNQNLDYFYTSNNRQNIMPILPDILFAQLHAIFLSDRFLFFPVWLSIVVTSYYIYKISMLINRSRNIAYLSGFIALIIPSQLAFMSSSQTDPISTVLVTILFYYAVLFNSKQEKSLIYLMIFMIPLFLTAKTTGLILSIPIYLFILVKYNRLIIKNLGKYFGFLILVILPSLPYVYRFWIFGTDKARGVFVSEPSLSGLVVNLWRISLTNLQSPLSIVNNLIEQFFYWGATNLRLEPNPIGYSSYGEFFLTSSLHGDSVGNPLHFIYLIIAIIVLRKSKTNRALIYLILTQFVLIGAFIGWQPWINRFTSTILVLGSILTGLWLGARSKTLRTLLVGVLVAYSLFWVFFNPTRAIANPKPLILIGQSLGVKSEYLNKIRYDLTLPRESQYFSARPEKEESYIQAGELIKEIGISKLYLKIGGDDFEYPIWALTGFSVLIDHFEESNIYEFEEGNVYLLCTQSCEKYGLELVFMDKYLSLWK
jgi:hypothetical protein